MKRDTTSKLTRMSFRWTWRVPNVWLKSSEFLIWCGELSRCGPSRLARYSASLYVGALMVLMMGLRGTCSFWIIGSPYNLGDLKSCGCSHYLVTYSGRGPFYKESISPFHGLCEVFDQFLICWIIHPFQQS
jgi:hypothetical protein